MLENFQFFCKHIQKIRFYKPSGHIWKMNSVSCSFFFLSATFENSVLNFGKVTFCSLQGPGGDEGCERSLVYGPSSLSFSFIKSSVGQLNFDVNPSKGGISGVCTL